MSTNKYTSYTSSIKKQDIKINTFRHKGISNISSNPKTNMNQTGHQTNITSNQSGNNILLTVNNYSNIKVKTMKNSRKY